MPAERQTTRENLIEVGLTLIRAGGYTATGINEILKVAALPKGSFYHHFPTKDAFVLEVIQRYATGEGRRLEQFLRESKLSPIKKLRRYFKDLIAVYGTGGGAIAGCLLGNLSLEVAGSNPEIRSLLREAFAGWQTAIATTIREAVAQGELPKTTRPDDLAALLVDGWEGAQVRAKTEQSDRPLQLFFDYAFGVLLKG